MIILHKFTNKKPLSVYYRRGGAGTGLQSSRFLATKRGSLSSSAGDDGLILPDESLNDDSQAWNANLWNLV